jgi:hypothetical protein
MRNRERRLVSPGNLDRMTRVTRLFFCEIVISLIPMQVATRRCRLLAVFFRETRVDPSEYLAD